jgi:2-polyprenyl-3-methyl-5-hydroxy-6-metoxy-1,4-benzoquinol methylase
MLSLFRTRKNPANDRAKWLYPHGFVAEDNPHYFERFCVWADNNNLSIPEFLLPQIRRKTADGDYAFERRFAASGLHPPTRREIDVFGTWEYQIRWRDVCSQVVDVLPSEAQFGRDRVWRTDDVRDFHRYRVSLLIDLAADIAGADRTKMSVLDVGCHLGLYSLEFAEAGFRSVKGLDHRVDNIAKAEFLKKTFHCPSVEFERVNARKLAGHQADVVFCGGLLYHVTFPFELIMDLFNATHNFLIFDSLCQHHPFSGFHLVGGRESDRSIDGDRTMEFMPTYRGIIDLLRQAGFSHVYEILGDRASQIYSYQTFNNRSFVATKHDFELPRKLRPDVAAFKPVSYADHPVL